MINFLPEMYLKFLLVPEDRALSDSNVQPEEGFDDKQTDDCANNLT